MEASPQEPPKNPETWTQIPPRSMADIELYLRRVINDPCFPYLVAIGEQMANFAEGGIPQKEDDNIRIIFAANVRKGFRMLWDQLQRRVSSAPAPTPFDSLLDGPVVSHVRETQSL